MADRVHRLSLAASQEVFAILISLICQHYIIHLFKYCDAKFAHRRVDKEAYEYRSPSVVALNANCNRKTARQEASKKIAHLEHVSNKSKMTVYFVWHICQSTFSAVRTVLYSRTTFNSNLTSSSKIIWIWVIYFHAAINSSRRKCKKLNLCYTIIDNLCAFRRNIRARACRLLVLYV